MARETRRTVDDVAGKCKILTGIDIDIPTGKEQKKTTPQDVYDSTAAAPQGRHLGCHLLAQVFGNAVGKPVGRRTGGEGIPAMTLGTKNRVAEGSRVHADRRSATSFCLRRRTKAKLSVFGMLRRRSVAHSRVDRRSRRSHPWAGQRGSAAARDIASAKSDSRPASRRWRSSRPRPVNDCDDLQRSLAVRVEPRTGEPPHGRAAARADEGL